MKILKTEIPSVKIPKIKDLLDAPDRLKEVFGFLDAEKGGFEKWKSKIARARRSIFVTFCQFLSLFISQKGIYSTEH
jgi:hypothetical protein